LSTSLLEPDAPWRTWAAADKLRLRRELWHRVARPEQRIPEGEWRTWYLQGGRGSGKTRSAAEAFAEIIEASEPGEWAIVAPTYGAARDVCVEGRSGLLQALGLPRTYDGWNRSMGELRLGDGSVVYVDGADDGALRVQGKNLRGVWCDEVGLWRRWDLAWRESIAFAVRLAPALVIASGTPKQGHGLVRLLVEDDTVVKSRLRTSDNLANLSPDAVADLEAAYAGTRRGRQELEGEWLDDVEGALWTMPLVEDARVAVAPALVRTVVGVDPAGTARTDSDETGIVAAGLAADGHVYVLADASCQRSPDGWARAVMETYDAVLGDRIVAEKTMGWDMVAHTLRTVDPSLPITEVHAAKSKRLRAEPVAALYEQGRVHHVGAFPALEDQMCSWVPGDASPDRVDALVYAVSDLVLGKPGRRRSIVVPEAA
jgi:phage terminase large subunit-like protein